MDADLFCNILESTLVPFIPEKLPDHRFMQDNDLKHTSRWAQAFFGEQNINWWRSPLESPDLNPIEDLWHPRLEYSEQNSPKWDLILDTGFQFSTPYHGRVAGRGCCLHAEQCQARTYARQ